MSCFVFADVADPDLGFEKGEDGVGSTEAPILPTTSFNKTLFLKALHFSHDIRQNQCELSERAGVVLRPSQ